MRELDCMLIIVTAWVIGAVCLAMHAYVVDIDAKHRRLSLILDKLESRRNPLGPPPSPISLPDPSPATVSPRRRRKSRWTHPLAITDLPTPPLCQWRPQACRHLNTTATAIREWRQKRDDDLNSDQQSFPACHGSPVRLGLRGHHFRAWWSHVMPGIIESAERDCPIACQIRPVPWPEADVIVDSLTPGPALYNHTRQKLALVALEHGGGDHGRRGHGTHSLQSLERVDLLVTWLRDSDVPINYMYAWQNLCEHVNFDLEQCLPPPPAAAAAIRKQRKGTTAVRLKMELVQKGVFKQKKLAAAFVSNCKAKERLLFMRELFNYLAKAGRPVDSWGRCLHTQDLPTSERQSIGPIVMSRAKPAPESGADAQKGMRKIALLETQYKFGLAFENSIRHDYVTEKALHPLLAGVIPVIWGAPRACDFLPGGANGPCINALDFATPQDLGQHLLYLDRNDSAYFAHFAWRHDQDLEETSMTQFQELQGQSFVAHGVDSWPCRLCQAYKQTYCL